MSTKKMDKDLLIELLKKDVSFKDKEIDRLEKENEELKNLPFIQYQKAILKITEVLDTESVFIRKEKIKRILEEYYYDKN